MMHSNIKGRSWLAGLFLLSVIGAGTATASELVAEVWKNAAQLTQLARQASDFANRLERQTTKPLLLDRFRISSPDGGFYDATVQRLLARSSCLRYDKSVRSVYGVGIQD